MKVNPPSYVLATLPSVPTVCLDATWGFGTGIIDLVGTISRNTTRYWPNCRRIYTCNICASALRCLAPLLIMTLPA